MNNIKLKNEAVGRRIGDKFFIIPTNNEVSEAGGLFETNEVGLFIWESIQMKSKTNLETLQYEVGKKFAVEEHELLREDLSEFLAALTELNLVEMDRSGEQI